MPAPPFRVCDVDVGQWPCQPVGLDERNRHDALLTQAQRIRQHKLDLFDLKSHFVGDPIDFNRDHKSGKAAPMGFAGWIDYRDFRVTGDCKFVWELNRHHHLVVLARAYRATGDRRYAQEIINQLDGWVHQCPFGKGMNWRSGLELAVRLINWVWAIDMIRESGLIEGPFHARLINSVHQHVWQIARTYSRGSSVGNHLVGEAAGVFVATSYFHHLPRAERYNAQSRRILAEQIINQTFPDGGSREQALGYHLFVLQFFLLAGIVARRTGADFPSSYWARLEKMIEFLATVSQGGQRVPFFGDCDDGYVLNLGNAPRELSSWLAIAAILFRRPDFKALAGGYCEPAAWLLGRSSRQQFDQIREDDGINELRSCALPDSGYYLLQYGRRDSPRQISVMFDCGPFGLEPLAGHAHADALSFTLRAFGREVFVDPGTYDYFTYPKWRRYFRSTAAHNTVMIDGQEQSVMVGPFMWRRHANARCLNFQATADGGKVVGEHDGYARLSNPVVHRRTLELNGPKGTLTIRDELIGSGRRLVDVFFHLAEHCQPARTGENHFTIELPGGSVSLQIDKKLNVSALRGSEEPIGGWVSRGYHQKAPTTTLRGQGSFTGKVSLVYNVKVEPSA